MMQRYSPIYAEQVTASEAVESGAREKIGNTPMVDMKMKTLQSVQLFTILSIHTVGHGILHWLQKATLCAAARHKGSQRQCMLSLPGRRQAERVSPGCSLADRCMSTALATSPCAHCCQSPALDTPSQRCILLLIASPRA